MMMEPGDPGLILSLIAVVLSAIFMGGPVVLLAWVISLFGKRR